MKIKLLLPFICVLALFSCVSITSLEGQVVDQAKVVLSPSKGIIPGERVKIVPTFLITVEDNDPEWFSSIDREELFLRFYTLEDFRVQPGHFTLPGFTFELLNKPVYKITLETLLNPLPVQEYTFPINWRLGKSWGFKGEDGRDGTVTKSGKNGGDGPDVIIEASYYDVSGTALEGTGTYILVYAVEYNKVMLVKADGGLHTISSTGGKGGRGREGESNYGATESNPDVYGEDGGPGADGGDGGHILFRYPLGGKSVAGYFRLKAPGGAEGEGGYGGRGSEWEPEDPDFGDVVKAVIGVNYGDEGRPGRKGRSGFISEAPMELDNMFVSLNMPGFDRSRLSVTPPVVETVNTVENSDTSIVTEDTDAIVDSENTDDAENLNEAESTEISPENYEDRAKELVDEEM